ncbi:MAG: hypothetical protein P4M00_24785 [Azospirillaceae bacterium]|nr:hypothetical protein [Azospirillaceae bacterium]
MRALRIVDPAPERSPEAALRRTDLWPSAPALRALLLEQGFSHAEIARRYGIAPIVIAGLAWRYGLRSATMAGVEQRLSLPLGPKEPIGCRFIVGDVPGLEWRYCQADPMPDSAYCRRHHAACHSAAPAEPVPRRD